MFTLTKDFLSLMFCQGRGEAGRKQRQDTSPKLAKEVFHTTARHAQYINWGSYPGGLDHCSGRAGHRSAGGERLCSLPLLFPLSLVLLVVAVVILCYTLVTRLFLSQPGGVTFLPFSSPSLQEQGRGRWGGVSERLRGSELPARLKPRQFFLAPSVGHEGLR